MNGNTTWVSFAEHSDSWPTRRSVKTLRGHARRSVTTLKRLLITNAQMAVGIFGKTQIGKGVLKTKENQVWQ